MVQPGESARGIRQRGESRESASQGMIVNSRAMVEKDEFVSTGIISAVEGDFVAIQIGEFMNFALNDLVKITVYVPGGIRSFHSKIIAKDEGHLYTIHPPQLQGEEKRESPRVQVEQEGSIIAMMSGSNRLAYATPLSISIRNVSISGVGFVLEDIHKLMPENVVELELKIGTIILCQAEVVRREFVEGGFFYGARFTDIAEERLTSLRAFILKEQIEAFSRQKEVPEATRKRVFR